MVARSIDKIMVWLGRREGLLLAGVLVVVAGAWGFIALADEVRERGTPRIDHVLNQYCYYHPGPRWLQEAGRDLTALGGIAVLTLIVGAVAGYLLLNRLRGMVFLVIAATLGALLLTTSLKHVIDRDRPPERQAGVIVYTQSFPSGHSALSASIYLTLGGLLARTTNRRAIKLYFICIALLLTFLIGCSRVYLGAHYPTDVLAGWTVGLVWAIVCWITARELQLRRMVEPENQSTA
jgi:undecaprenyl-diphosphatase